MHKLLVRAVVTGFGLRIGSELAKFVANKILPKEKKDEKNDDGEDEEDDPLGSVTADPPEIPEV